MREDMNMPDIPQPGYVLLSSNVASVVKANPNTENQLVTGSLSLQTLVDSFSASSLHFTPWQVATFYTALQTKGFVILSGISGTGKTKLAQAFARLLPQPDTVTIIPEDIIHLQIW